MSEHHSLVPVTLDEAGQRLDRWLSRCLPEISRTRLKALIEAGAVTLADGMVLNDASSKVKAGMAVTVAVPDSAPPTPLAQDIPLDILYEDDDLIVLNKPVGLVVHPAPGSPDQTLVNALLAHCGDDLSGIGGVKRPGIVHRLDKDTSGIMVVAKNDLAHHGLAQQFEVHSIDRAYVALVWGCPVPLQGDISGNIGRSPTNRKKMAVVAGGGKRALTHYRVLKRYFDGALSLVECRLATGRTHQIRVHLTSQGHPLVGDGVYGGGAKASRTKSIPPEAKAKLADFPRQALHATLLGFIHPRSGKHLIFEQGIPPDLADLTLFLEKL